MSRDKQIEEMAKTIYEQDLSYDTYYQTHCERLATDLYNAGYRKASDLAEENERLTRLANLRQRDLDNANDLLFKVEDENERLRATTVREMQERLDKRFCHDPAFLGVEQRLIMGVIDQIAKEMLEGKNEN